MNLRNLFCCEGSQDFFAFDEMNSCSFCSMMGGVGRALVSGGGESFKKTLHEASTFLLFSVQESCIPVTLT